MSDFITPDLICGRLSVAAVVAVVARRRINARRQVMRGEEKPPPSLNETETDCFYSHQLFNI